MAFRFTDTDLEILAAIAEHRVLSVRQLTTLLQRNRSATRRRLGILQDNGLIRMSTCGFGRNRGRPENLLSLREEGVDLLKAKGEVHKSVPYDGVTADKITCLEHELLINDFRTQLALMERFLPVLSTRFFSSKSPRVSVGSLQYPFVRERIRADESLGEWIEFTPDGVLALTHKERGMTLLFFLEVDRETEPLTSQRHQGRGLRQKIRNYQAYFELKRYQRYEEILACKLRGFRLLILTISQAHLVKLCRLVVQSPPSDFIWLADCDSMHAEGLWAPIWARGGRSAEALQSILGTAMPNPCPSPASLT